MPGELVGRQVYQIPTADNSNTLSNPQNTRRLVQPERQYYPLLHRSALNLGLQETPDIETPKATWKMYRGNLAIPNFGAPDTNASVELGLYEVPDMRAGAVDSSATRIARNAILRLSETQPNSSFYDDIRAFTKYYMERPKLMGLPNRFHSFPRYLCAGFVVGHSLGTAVDYWTTGQIAGFNMMLGDAIGPTAGGIAYIVIESHASRHISNLDSYRADREASNALNSIEQHITKVSIQRELYAALQDGAKPKEPEEFLKDIWQEIPKRLIEKRKEEMKQARGEGTYINPFPIDALDRMVQVARLVDIPSTASVRPI